MCIFIVSLICIYMCSFLSCVYICIRISIDICSIHIHIQGASKKMLHSDFPKICSRGQILLFLGCFLIRISCLNHLGTLIMPINYLKCVKNAENACTDMRKERYISEYLDFMWILIFNIYWQRRIVHCD